MKIIFTFCDVKNRAEVSESSTVQKHFYNSLLGFTLSRNSSKMLRACSFVNAQFSWIICTFGLVFQKDLPEKGLNLKFWNKLHEKGGFWIFNFWAACFLWLKAKDIAINIWRTNQKVEREHKTWSIWMSFLRTRAVTLN